MVGETVREVCGKLVGEGLCALQEVGAEVVGGVDEIVFFAEGDCGLGGGFSGAGDQVQLRAVDLNLAELGLGGGVGGENVGLDATSGGVGSDGGPALPEESSTISSTPNSRATASITAVPRSLNEPVGAANSSLA